MGAEVAPQSCSEAVVRRLLPAAEQERKRPVAGSHGPGVKSRLGARYLRRRKKALPLPMGITFELLTTPVTGVQMPEASAVVVSSV